MASDNANGEFNPGMMKVEIVRMQRLLYTSAGPTPACKAFCKVRFKTQVGSVSVDNFRVIESSKKELFVAPPSHQKGKKWYDDVEVTEDLRKFMEAAILSRYRQESGGAK